VKYLLRPVAKDDILRQFRYYLSADALDVATRFLEAVDQSIETICAMPQIGAPIASGNPILSGMRFWPVKDFEDILIFYTVQPEVLRVVRILHGKRDIKRILQREKDEEAPG
jgi:toxin ParE1/3/4